MVTSGLCSVTDAEGGSSHIPSCRVVGMSYFALAENLDQRQEKNPLVFVGASPEQVLQQVDLATGKEFQGLRLLHPSSLSHTLLTPLPVFCRLPPPPSLSIFVHMSASDFFAANPSLAIALLHIPLTVVIFRAGDSGHSLLREADHLGRIAFSNPLLLEGHLEDGSDVSEKAIHALSVREVFPCF